MGRLRELLEELERFYAQLSRRERLLVLAAAGCAVLFVGSIAFGTVRSSTARREMAIQEKSEQLQQIAVYAQTYSETERTRRELEGRLSGPPLRLLSHMQELADKHGLGIGSMSERGESTIDQVKETVVELQIGSASIDKLTALLNEIERNQRIVKVKKLRVRRQTGDPKALNVNLTVGTYQLAGKG